MVWPIPVDKSYLVCVRKNIFSFIFSGQEMESAREPPIYRENKVHAS
jgi:hypothetical protein